MHPVGCIPPAAVAVCWGEGVCLETPPRCETGDTPGCGPGDPPGMGLETIPPWVWAWRHPPGVGLEPPKPDASTSPWVWAWRPPWLNPSISALGVGLEIPPPPWRPACWVTNPPPF